ncbi:MAG: methyltransferase domain-containing protein [Rhodanobacteraceae bacterium]|nr:MAG: methyltransferase domain-containing protein [Rhodanobacteraceae bacterium]
MLARRDLVGELMDDPALAAQAHHIALRGLQRINRVSRTAAVLWPRIERILSSSPNTRASLLDVACGGGDLAIAIAQRSRQRGLVLQVQGCDFSDTALQHASQAATRVGVPVKFFGMDVTAELPPQHYTFITCTLFLHHLTDARIVTLLRTLAGHSDHLLVSDLIRGQTGYLLAWMGTKLLSRSPIVHEDGLRSVRAALTLHEARKLATEARLNGARFERHWPQRFLMTWSRTHEALHGSG